MWLSGDIGSIWMEEGTRCLLFREADGADDYVSACAVLNPVCIRVLVTQAASPAALAKVSGRSFVK